MPCRSTLEPLALHQGICSTMSKLLNSRGLLRQEENLENLRLKSMLSALMLIHNRYFLNLVHFSFQSGHTTRKKQRGEHCSLTSVRSYNYYFCLDCLFYQPGVHLSYMQTQSPFSQYSSCIFSNYSTYSNDHFKICALSQTFYILEATLHLPNTYNFRNFLSRVEVSRKFITDFTQDFPSQLQQCAFQHMRYDTG